MDSLVSLATAPAAVTTTFTNGLAAVIVILAILGLYALFNLKGAWRAVALVLLIGILVVNIGVLHDIGLSIRSAISSFAIDRGWPEVTGDLTFTLLLVVVFVALYLLSRRSTSDLWKWLMVLVALLIFTMSWASDLIVWLSIRAADFLGWIQRINF
jgi:hypothetical protein